MSVRWQKNGSFGFAKRWLLCRAKPNVPNVRLAFMLFVCLFMLALSSFRVAYNGEVLAQVAV
jgi:hypothetical protein